MYFAHPTLHTNYLENILASPAFVNNYSTYNDYQSQVECVCLISNGSVVVITEYVKFIHNILSRNY